MSDESARHRVGLEYISITISLLPHLYEAHLNCLGSSDSRLKIASSGDVLLACWSRPGHVGARTAFIDKEIGAKVV